MVRTHTIVAGLWLGLCACADWSSVRAADDDVLQAEQQRVEVVERAARSVVAIFANGGAGGGSGVVVTPDGYVLTNFHVVQGSGHFMKCGLNDGVLYDAVLVGIDPTGDVAMIRLLGRDDFPAATLGDSDKVQVGDWAYAMGNPFLLATDFHPTVTYGVVSGVHRYQYPAGNNILEYTDCIQVDSSINPGNSGGPLFNDQGELVGINGRGSFEKRGRVNSGAGYAISINQIKHFMDHLRSGRIVDHATLGATLATDDRGQVIVSNILEKSEAYRRGLRVDDEIVSFSDRPIGSVNQFKNVLGIYPKGWALPLVYRHEGEKHEVYVRLRGVHRKSELTGKPKQRGPMPEPKNPDDPKEDKPKNEKPGQPRRPMPAAHAAPSPPPEKYKHMYVAKEGYANYWFNEQEQKRVLAGVAPFGDFSKSRGLWKLTGKQGEVPFTFKLDDNQLGLILGDAPYLQELKDLVDLQPDPPGTGGLLVAMHHLRLFLTRGKNGFTDFYSLGSEPLDGRGERVDVIVAELSGASSYWYFSQATGQLLGFRFELTEDADACEIRFEEVGEFGGVKIPTKLHVRHADQDVGTFVISTFTAAVGMPDPVKPETAEKPKEEPAKKTADDNDSEEQ
ncbi:MAG TPA: trypsin-like peptidase domain-containing protein [Planctomycetaceae bacterium]|nr:trypsin-like peptidase domain-containing protein [Planctomycetaceae bacterium]